MTAFDKHLLDIHEEISVQDRDRQPYMNIVKNFNEWLMQEMCNVDSLFKNLYRTNCMFGRYSQRARTIKPTEFDVCIILEIPSLSIALDCNWTGIVTTSLRYFFGAPKQEPFNEHDYATLVNLLDENYSLKLNTFQWWIHGIFEKVLTTRYVPYTHSITYTDMHVAHNICLSDSRHPSETISIDFLPAIKICNFPWMHVGGGGNVPLKNEHYYSFHLIPKYNLPCNNGSYNNITFQLINPLAEQELLWNKPNLKIVYDLVKSFRNCMELRNLKSQFLTSLFLWEVQRRNDDFWKNSIGFLFLHMLDTLHYYLEHGNLPYFWILNGNLLNNIVIHEKQIYLDIIVYYNRSGKMSPFEEHLQRIHQHISIKDEDCEGYILMFDHVKNWLFREMCNRNPVFQKLYKGTRLFGSYSNRVRIIKPSEFDVFFILDLPFSMAARMDVDRPGFVHLYLEDTLEDLANHSYYDDVYNTFYDLTNNNYYLKRTELQWWIQDIIDEVIDNSYPPYGYTIEYSKCSVAHQIRVWDNSYDPKFISIDFVPAISFGKYPWMNIRKYLPFKDEHFYSFLVIPKSLRIGTRKNSNITFQLVNPEAEREILWNKNNLKVVYRLLKSFRNQNDMRRLKSYFLTTVFLWEVQKLDDDFWQDPVDDIFVYMLGKLADYFDNKKLPYFWARGFNLLDILRPEEVTEYAKILSKAWTTIKQYPYEPRLSLERT